MSVARHTFYNVTGSAVPIAVALLTTPIYLHVVGLERYGVLSICWVLLGYFNLFDFGLGRATSQRLATLAAADPAERSEVFWTSMSLSGLFSIAALAIFIPASSWGLGLLGFDTKAVAAEVPGALPWLVAAVPLGLFNSVFLGALEGRRSFLAQNLAFSLSTALTSVLPLIAALVWGPELRLLLAASFLGRLIGVSCLFLACIRAVPARSPIRPHREQAQRLLGYGRWTMISNTIGPILVMWDRFAIGAMIGAAAVAIYTVPASLVSQLLVIPGALASALFPRLAAAEHEEVGSLSEESLELLAFLVTPMALLGTALAGPFLVLWLGPRTGMASAPVAALFLFGLWANSLARIPSARLQARGRPDLVALLHLSELLPYVAILYFCLKSWGVAGAAFAWSLRSTADALALYLLSRAPRRSLAPLLLHALLLAAAIAAVLYFPIWSPLKWLVLALLSAACAILLLRRSPARVALVARQILGRASALFGRARSA